MSNSNRQQIDNLLIVAQRWTLPAVLGSILFLGAAIRMIGISDNPPGFFTDEASIGYNAYTLLNSGKDEHGEAWPILFKSLGDYKLPVIIYSTVPFVALLGLTEFAVRITSATYGTLTIVTTFLVTSALFRDRRISIAAALFLAIMPWHIHYSRTGFGELISFLPFLTGGLYMFLVGVKNNRLWPIAGLILGISLHTYRASWIVLPALLLTLAILYRKDIIKGWRMAILGLLTLLILSLPILLHLVEGNGDRSQDAGLLRLDLTRLETVKVFLLQYFIHFSPGFLFDNGDNGDITRHYLPGFGQLYTIQFPLIVIGIVSMLFNLNREKTIVLSLMLIYPLAGALSDTSPISSRTILGTVVFSILSGYGFVMLWNYLKYFAYPHGRFIALAIGLSVWIVSFASFTSYLNTYHKEYRKLSEGYWGWQSGPKEIIDYFVTVEERYDQLVMDWEFNAPHEFFQFYAPGRCSKCLVGDTRMYDPSKRQIFALKSKHLSNKYNYKTLHKVWYPSGELAFSVTEITGKR